MLLGGSSKYADIEEFKQLLMLFCLQSLSNKKREIVFGEMWEKVVHFAQYEDAEYNKK